MKHTDGKRETGGGGDGSEVGPSTGCRQAPLSAAMGPHSQELLEACEAWEPW